MASFSLPKVEDNTEGWGPTSLPEDLQDIPYAPFSKSDKLGRVSDWAAQSNRGKGYEQRDRLYTTGVSNQTFNFFQGDEESSFHLVDNKGKSKTVSGFRPTHRGNVQRARGGYNQRNYQKLGGAKGQRQQAAPRQNNRGRFQSWRDYDKPQRSREASVEVKASWKVLEEVEFSRLSKLTYDPGEPETLLKAGSVMGYDKSYDRVTTKTERPLQVHERIFHNVTTSEDPIIKEFADKGEANVFGIDCILALLMVCSRSVYSWDIVVNRVGDQLFFDKRDGSQFDYITVNETAHDAPTDEKGNINSAESLALEATYINQNFSQQVLKQDEIHEFERPNPFDSGNDSVAPVGYSYRKFNLGDGLTMICRTEVHGYMKYQNQDAFLTIQSLNEFDPRVSGVDWRQKLDSQHGAVLATELKNNSNKLAIWTARALLSGADQMKIGYVSRVNPRDQNKHAILHVPFYKPHEFATQINLNENNAWGVVKTLVNICMRLPEGKYLLMKDPNKALMRLYDIPNDSFEEVAVDEEVPVVEQEDSD